jgi:hypothetical protein
MKIMGISTPQKMEILHKSIPWDLGLKKTIPLGSTDGSWSIVECKPTIF